MDEWRWSWVVGIGGVGLGEGVVSSPIFFMWIVNALWSLCFVSVVVVVASP